MQQMTHREATTGKQNSIGPSSHSYSSTKTNIFHIQRQTKFERLENNDIVIALRFHLT